MRDKRRARNYLMTSTTSIKTTANKFHWIAQRFQLLIDLGRTRDVQRLLQIARQVLQSRRGRIHFSQQMIGRLRTHAWEHRLERERERASLTSGVLSISWRSRSRSAWKWTVVNWNRWDFVLISSSSSRRWRRRVSRSPNVWWWWRSWLSHRSRALLRRCIWNVSTNWWISTKR